MALPESQMRAIRLELYQQTKAVADAIEQISTATDQRLICEARRTLIHANDKLQALIRDAQTRALRSPRGGADAGTV